MVTPPEDEVVERLLNKLDRWLLQQPEWLFVMNSPRATRKRVAKIVAEELLLIPVRAPTSEPPRAKRRAIFKAMKGR